MRWSERRGCDARSFVASVLETDACLTCGDRVFALLHQFTRSQKVEFVTTERVTETSCRCAELSVLWEEDAKDFASSHLEVVEVRAGGWEVEFRCPNTELRWLEDWPAGEEQGGGPRRLRRLPEGNTTD